MAGSGIERLSSASRTEVAEARTGCKDLGPQPMAKRSGTSQIEDGLSALVLAQLDKPRARVLVAGAGEAELATRLAARGATVTTWDRLAGPGRRARPWPEAGEVDEVLIRLPRARASFEMALHAVATKLAAGGALWVFGKNDEGIRSAPSRIEALFDDVVVADARGHGRIFHARRKLDLAGLKATLAEWRSVVPIELPGGERPWVTYPGLFARGGVDAATAFLLESLPRFPEGSRVLDYGCGTGIIGAALEQRGERIELDQLDADALAVEAAGENLPRASTWLGFHLGDIPPTIRWHRVVSNPPIHESVVRSYRVLEELAAELGGRLENGGEAWLVCQRQVPIAALFGAAGFKTQVHAERSAFRVWQVHAHGPGPKATVS